MLNYTFELNSTDLFEDIGDRKYFLVNFARNSDIKWVLGRPFLSKYNFTYDIDARTVGMYFGKKEVIPEPNDGKFDIVWIFVIFSGFIIIVLSVIIYILIKKIPRKRRANELEENLDYKEKEDNLYSGDKNYNNVNSEEKNKFGIDV